METAAPYCKETADYFDRVMQRKEVEPIPYEVARPIFYDFWRKLVDAPVHLDKYDAWIPREFLKWLIQDPSCELDLRKGIFMTGTHGCGKTTLMRTGQLFAVKCLGESYGFRTIFNIKKEVDSQKSITALDRYLRGDWCFDDIGQQDENVVIYSKYNIVEMLICSRINTRYKTMATSNLLPAEISGRYGPVVASRFNQLFNPLVFQTNKDLRKK